MSHHEIPKSIAQAIATMTSPYLGRQVRPDEIVAALQAIRMPTVRLGKLAESRGITRQGMMYRLKTAGIKPAGKQGNETIYNVVDVVGI